MKKLLMTLVTLIIFFSVFSAMETLADPNCVQIRKTILAQDPLSILDPLFILDVNELAILRNCISTTIERKKSTITDDQEPAQSNKECHELVFDFSKNPNSLDLISLNNLKKCINTKISEKLNKKYHEMVFDPTPRGKING